MGTLVATALTWAAIGLPLGVLVGTAIKLADRRDDGHATSEERWAQLAEERCCDGEFCGVWDSCLDRFTKESRRKG